MCVGFRVSDSIYLGYQKTRRGKKKTEVFERLLNDAASLYYKTAFVFLCSLFSAKRDTYTHTAQKTNFVSRSCSRTVVVLSEEEEEEEEEELVFDTHRIGDTPP